MWEIKMISLEEFHQDFLQSILSDAQSRGLLKPQSFFENVCEELISTGDLTNNYTAAEYTKKGLEVYGYDYDEERQILSLLVHQFFQEDEIQTLTKNIIDIKFKRLKTFYNKCVDGIYENMEQAYDHYSMAYSIYNYYTKNKIDKVRLIIITDGKATRNLVELESEIIDGIQIDFRVIDIAYLHKIYLSENSGGDFEINIKLPSLEIETSSDEYKSYLSYMKGSDLANIYGQFGQKLFEQNVRTFLQFRGNVNKGLKNTIEYNPEMFFAYNNGITATASEVEMDDFGNIIKIKNFQIVNGAQTTSAIYASSINKKNPIDVSNIFVQMKLSVVKDKEKQNDFVSKVSEYANTQNKVNKSDFFSNSPFHKEFKTYSKRVWVAAVGGSQRRTHWFYERVRGEYLNEQTYLTVSEKKQFQLENPKKQFIDKKLLGKTENTWLQKPNIVSKGAEFSLNFFAETITKKLEKDNLAITESYFKDSICRIIMFKEVEKLVSKADWYNGGYRANVVAYTISYLSYIVEKQNKYLDFNKIWEIQELPQRLFEILEKIAEKIHDNITNPPEGNANVSQWCKKVLCWDAIKKLNLDVNIEDNLLLDKEEKKYNKKEEKKDKKLDNDIEIQSFVIKFEKEKWKKLLEYYKKDELKFTISSMQFDILNKYALGYMMLPSPKQSKILYQLYNEAINDGLIL
jgi:hypothetical protein